MIFKILFRKYEQVLGRFELTIWVHKPWVMMIFNKIYCYMYKPFYKTFKITIMWHSILNFLWQSTSLDIVENLESNHTWALILGRRSFKFYYIKSMISWIFIISLFLELAGFIFLKVSRSPRIATILLPPRCLFYISYQVHVLITKWQFWSWPWSMTSVKGNIPPGHRQPFLSNMSFWHFLSSK